MRYLLILVSSMLLFLGCSSSDDWDEDAFNRAVETSVRHNREREAKRLEQDPI